MTIEKISQTKFADIYANPNNYDYKYMGTLFIDPKVLEKYDPLFLITEFDKSLHKRFEDSYIPFESEYYFDKISNLGYEVHFFFKGCNLEKYMTLGLKTKSFEKFNFDLWNHGLSLINRFYDYMQYKKRVK